MRPTAAVGVLLALLGAMGLAGLAPPGSPRPERAALAQGRPQLRLAKTADRPLADIGLGVGFRLDYGNDGDVPASGVVLTETVPAGSMFDALASSPGWRCPSGTGAGSLCTLDVGRLEPGAAGSGSFAVRLQNVPALTRPRKIQALVNGRSDPSGTPVEALRSPRSLAVAPDGRDLYAAAHGDSSLVHLARDPSTGALTFRGAMQEAMPDGDGVVVSGLYGAVAAAVSPDGAHVYATGALANAVAAFARDDRTGGLSFLGSLSQGSTDSGGTLIEGLSFPTSVVASPDGKHVYVTGGLDDALTAFQRNPDTGSLTHVETLFEAGVDGAGNRVDGLAFPETVVVTPDGRHVYVAATGASAVLVFAIDPTTGRLTFVEALRDGDLDATGERIHGLGGGIADTTDAAAGPADPTRLAAMGLGGATAVAVSPDGRNVYATGRYDHAVVTFAREPVSGRLTFLESLVDGSKDGVGRPLDGLRGARSVTAAPFGTHVYVTGTDEDKVAVFQRDPTSGLLRVTSVLAAGSTDVSGQVLDALMGPFAVALGPDGAQLYVVASDSDALSAFAAPALSNVAAIGATDMPSGGSDPTRAGAGVRLVARGDCNADVRVDAGDISALVLEIFDGDGSTVPPRDGDGTFAGDPDGCNANGDDAINAGDVSCLVLTLFNGPGACRK